MTALFKPALPISARVAFSRLRNTQAAELAYGSHERSVLDFRQAKAKLWREDHPEGIRKVSRRRFQPRPTPRLRAVIEHLVTTELSNSGDIEPTIPASTIGCEMSNTVTSLYSPWMPSADNDTCAFE